MGQVIVSTSNLKGLADIIRLKSGKSDLMTLDSMPRRIRLLPGRVSNKITVRDLCQGSGSGYVANVAKTTGADIKVESFIRLVKGEGLEKKEENFADEVMKQING